MTFSFFAADKEEHDVRLRAVLDRMAKAGTTLNLENCMFQQSELKFLGHVLNQDGVSPDPEKTRAIALMLPPEGVPCRSPPLSRDGESSREVLSPTIRIDQATTRSTKH